MHRPAPQMKVGRATTLLLAQALVQQFLLAMTMLMAMLMTTLMVLYVQNAERLMMARRDQAQRPTTKQRRQKRQKRRKMITSGHSAQ